MNSRSDRPLEVFNYSRCGKKYMLGRYVNKLNEDSRISDGYRGIFITADGLGGHSGAKMASDHAVRNSHLDMMNIIRSYNRNNLTDDKILERIAQSTDSRNAELVNLGRSDNVAGCATTLDLVIVLNDKIFGAHVGDGTVYKIDTVSGLYVELTERIRIKKGLYPGFSDVEYDIVESSEVAQCLGRQDTHAQLYQEMLSPSEVLLLATDGFTKKVHIDETVEAFMNHDFIQASYTLVNICKRPRKMAGLVQDLGSAGYHIAGNIFHDDTTFIAAHRRY